MCFVVCPVHPKLSRILSARVGIVHTPGDVAATLAAQLHERGAQQLQPTDEDTWLIDMFTLRDLSGNPDHLLGQQPRKDVVAVGRSQAF